MTRFYDEVLLFEVTGSPVVLGLPPHALDALEAVWACSAVRPVTVPRVAEAA